jgi:glycosyltransferase involved in cell wall biosynthesis
VRPDTTEFSLIDRGPASLAGGALSLRRDRPEGAGSIARVGVAAEASIVVPAFDAADHLSRCVASLCAQRGESSFEIIVVVSGDEGDDLDYADQLPVDPRLTVLVHRPRLSAAEGRNLGVTQAGGDTLVFTDADVVAQEGWLAALVTASAGHRCVAGAVVNGTPRSWAGTTEYMVEFLDLHPGRPPETIWHGATCNLAVPRSLWEAYGPFVDASSSIKEVGSADTTFTLQASADGRLDFCPAARVVHMNRTGLPTVLRHQVMLGRCAAVLARRSPTYPHRRLVTRSWAVPLVVGARWLSLWRRLLTWRIGLAPRALVLTPYLVAALAAWGKGLYQANRASADPS